jgi:hypothetical protein
MKKKLLIGGSLVCVLMVMVALGVTGASRTSKPSADPKVVSAMRELLAELPAAEGATEREQIRSMLGMPDAFVVSYERAIRYETWHYYAAASSFEFSNGRLVTNLPLDEVKGPSLLPRQYDPAGFQRGMPIDQVKAMLADPQAAVTSDMPSELGVPLTTLTGEQLLAVFDSKGLVYAETVPLQPGASS